MRSHKVAARPLWCSLVLVINACASAHPVPSAKSITPLSPGDRLRVTHSSICCANRSIGIEQSLSADSLVIKPQPGTAQLAIARSNITQIERWNRGSRHLAGGAVLGTFTGALAGGFIGYQSTCGHCDGDMRPLGALEGVVLGGAAGLVTGIVVGAHHHGFWETVHPK